jgi:DNA (cytosine-5)-methyltransferase 1
METIKILNLYACLGGNRYKWNEISENIHVTAVELDKSLCDLYAQRFPNDTVINADAHEFLLKHFKEFDFIWTSPPCPTHSRAAYGSRLSEKDICKNFEVVYPDLKLYEEILLLQYYFKGKFCVENVIPFYEPLILPQIRGRHAYWTNFKLPSQLNERKDLLGLIGGGSKMYKGKKLSAFEQLCLLHEIDLTNYNGPQDKIKIARNLVDYEAGKTIFETFFNLHTNQTKQVGLFETLNF